MVVPAVIFEVTDYEATYVGNILTSNFRILKGDMKEMKKADPTKDSPDSYVKIIGENWLRGRYAHAACISLNEKMVCVAQTIISDHRVYVENCITSIINYFTSRFPDTLIVSSVVRDIWLHGGAEDIVARDLYQPLFERMGFIDSFGGGKLYDGEHLPFGLMTYASNLGGIGVIENMKDWW